MLQHTSISSDGKLLLVVGDNPESMLVDSQNGKVEFIFLFGQATKPCFYYLYPKISYDEKVSNLRTLFLQTIVALSGHLDFSFASAWNPDGVTFATGNQDKTCRIWDMRNLSKSVEVLKGNLGAVRSIRYTSDGRYMAIAEPADFVHIYDVKNGYEMEQEIDFFGEISGISFSPDTESLFIGVWDRVYASLLEYGWNHNAKYEED